MFLFKKVSSISTRELHGMLTKRPTIIDVREKHEFASGHIPGAVNVPLNKVNNYKHKGKEKIYVICQSGMRSKRAVGVLENNGIEAINVKGGMSQWTGPVRGGK